MRCSLPYHEVFEKLIKDSAKREKAVNMHMVQINMLLKRAKHKVAKIVGIFIQKHTFQRQLPSFLSRCSHSGVYTLS